MTADVEPTWGGRFGVRQFYRGNPTGGGTVGLGWATVEEAAAQNPPVGEHTFQPFERWEDTEAVPVQLGLTVEDVATGGSRLRPVQQGIGPL